MIKNKWQYFYWCILLTFIVLVLPTHLGSSSAELHWTALDISSQEADVLIRISETMGENASHDAIIDRFRRSVRKAHVFERYRSPLDRRTLEQEAARIQASSVSPGKLREVQRLFEGEEDLYLRLFVMPTYVERELPFVIFPDLEEAHQGQRAYAEEVLTLALARPDELEEIANERGLSYHRFVLQKSELTRNVDEAKEPILETLPENPGLKKPSIESKAVFLWSHVIGTTQGGQTLNQLIEGREDFCIASNRSRNRDGYFEIDEICLPKKNFDVWLQEQIKERGL